MVSTKPQLSELRLFILMRKEPFFLVTLPSNKDCQLTKSLTKLHREEGDIIMMESLNFDVLNQLLIKDISDVRDYIREKKVSMPVTKSVTKIIELTEYLAAGTRKIDLKILCINAG